MPSSGFSWGAKLSEIADAVWSRSVRDLTNLPDARAAKIDNLDALISSRATAADVWSYSNRRLTSAVYIAAIYPAEVLQVSADTERSGTDTSYVKVKEIWVPHSGLLRVRFDIRTNYGSYPAYGRVYKNGVAVGAELYTNSTVYETKSVDISVRDGDLIQLYARVSSSGTYYVRNFRLYYDFDLTTPVYPQVVQD